MNQPQPKTFYMVLKMKNNMTIKNVHPLITSNLAASKKLNFVPYFEVEATHLNLVHGQFFPTTF